MRAAMVCAVFGVASEVPSISFADQVHDTKRKNACKFQHTNTMYKINVPAFKPTSSPTHTFTMAGTRLAAPSPRGQQQWRSFGRSRRKIIRTRRDALWTGPTTQVPTALAYHRQHARHRPQSSQRSSASLAKHCRATKERKRWKKEKASPKNIFLAAEQHLGVNTQGGNR